MRTDSPQRLSGVQNKMSMIPTIVFILSGVTAIYFTVELNDQLGMWSITLGIVLIPIALSLVFERFQRLTKGICAFVSGITGLFIVLSLIGSTIGSGMSPEFKPMFACFVALCVSGFFAGRNKRNSEETDPST